MWIATGVLRLATITAEVGIEAITSITMIGIERVTNPLIGPTVDAAPSDGCQGWPDFVMLGQVNFS